MLAVAEAAAGLTLAGCGFRPLYAPPDEAAFDAQLASIKVNSINNRVGQLLAMQLRDSFNPTGASVQARYALSVSLSVTRRDLGIRPDATASRSEIDIRAQYSLLDIRSNNVVFTGSSRSASAFNVLDDDYATIVAQNDAQMRLIQDLSDDIRTRLAVFLQYRPPGSAPQGA
jgi:LPS-assembly lipoprotein